MNIQDVISSSILIAHVVPLILFTIDGKSFHKVAFFGMLLAQFIPRYIRNDIIKERSTRPKGATNCDLLCMNGNREGKPGMPSSHAATAAFFAFFYFHHTHNSYIRIGLICYAALVMYSRYDKKCHTIPQIAVGAVVGVIIAVLLDL